MLNALSVNLGIMYSEMPDLSYLGNESKMKGQYDSITYFSIDIEYIYIYEEMYLRRCVINWTES